MNETISTIVSCGLIGAIIATPFVNWMFFSQETQYLKDVQKMMHESSVFREKVLMVTVENQKNVSEIADSVALDFKADHANTEVIEGTDDIRVTFVRKEKVGDTEWRYERKVTLPKEVVGELLFALRFTGKTVQARVTTVEDDE